MIDRYLEEIQTISYDLSQLSEAAETLELMGLANRLDGLSGRLNTALLLIEQEYNAIARKAAGITPESGK